MAGVGGIAPERLVFLDECGVLTNLARIWGRWRRVTVPGAPGTGGVVAAMGVEAATSSAVFAACLDRILSHDLCRTKPDAVLEMDDLSAHKTPEVRRSLDRSGFTYRCLPPWSPDPNPIGPAWAKAKAPLRRTAARAAEALRAAIGSALDAIAARAAAGLFRHAGHGRPK